MAFRLRTTPQAERDIVEAAAFIANDSPERARRWFVGIKSRLREIPQAPLAFPIVPEAQEIGVELRQARFHSHRIIFRVDAAARVVDVLRVHHAARRDLRSEDLP